MAEIRMSAVAFLAAALTTGAAAEASAAREGDGSARDWSQIYLALNPSVSRDGSFFVFEWKDRVWRAPTSGGTAVPIGDGMSAERRPFLSPDGKRVAFLSDRWGTEQLFEVQLDGEALAASGMRQVTFHTESLMPWGYTPDGSAMLSLVYRDDASEGSANMRLSRRPALIPMAGRKAEWRIFDAPAFSPSMSPDGKKVLFASGIEELGVEFRKRHDWSVTSYSGDIWMYDAATGALTPVVVRREGCSYPIWTPDGKGFYYLCDAGGIRNVYHRLLDGGAERQVTHFTDDHVFSPALSGDGRTMVFAKGFDMWRIDPTLDDPRPVRISLRPALSDPSAPRSVRRSYANFDNNYGEGDCTFRDKGKEAAFTAGGDLWVMELKDDDRQPVCLHGSSRTHERECVFSPDGDTLYYTSDRGDGTDVWRMRRADTNRLWSANVDFVRERLTSDDVSRRGFSISPDGRLLAWYDMTGRFSFADTNGVVLCVSKVPSADCDSYAWSPDGRYVAASLRDGYNNIDVWIIPTWEKDADGAKAPAPCNISRNCKWDGHPAWSPDGRVVAFAGDRAATGGSSYVFYAYLDPADEDAEASGGEIRKAPCRPDFATLPDRVRKTDVKGYSLFFSPDNRTLSYYSGGKMHKTKLPKCSKQEDLLGKSMRICEWVKDGDKDKLIGVIDRKPAIGDKTYGFNLYQTTDIQDYQELSFLSAWANQRDCFCDPNMHGADWPAVREKYRLAARYAPSWSVFCRIVRMMHGELDASHLGFYAGDTTKSRWSNKPWSRGWKIFTVHLGVRFDQSYKGDGWLVRDVIPRSPADHGEEGLLPWDIVLSVDGRRVTSDMDRTEVLNGPLPHKYRLSVRRGKDGKTIEREIDGISYGTARRHLRTAEVEKVRELVRRKGNFGYLAVDEMNSASADAFADQAFAECFGKDGLIVDVRFNSGGRTADRLIDILCGNRHARILYRGAGTEGYLLDRYSRPVVTTLPVVVLANQRSESNAEEFTHAMKLLKRAKVVGRETSGAVIGTVDVNVFDYGVTRRPRIGFFLRDGTDMEGNGAKPDIEVDLTPADIAAGRDPQLDVALETLAAEVAARVQLPPLKYAPGK